MAATKKKSNLIQPVKGPTPSKNLKGPVGFQPGFGQQKSSGKSRRRSKKM